MMAWGLFVGKSVPLDGQMMEHSVDEQDIVIRQKKEMVLYVTLNVKRDIMEWDLFVGKIALLVILMMVHFVDRRTVQLVIQIMV
jgi:hypothetical protein